MAFVFAGFDWDAGNRGKCQQHGVSVHEIESMFLGSLSVYPDLAHSQAEERFKAIGQSAAGRYIFLVFTVRLREGNTHVRPISAR